MRRIAVAIAMTLFAQPSTAPQARITNGLLDAVIYLPDAAHGYFRGTRFDWAGIVGRLTYQGHVFYQPWFTGTDPAMRDYTAGDREVIAGPNTAITGPAEEFRRPLGYEEAVVGGVFVKVGVGALRKPDSSPYSAFRLYEIADNGKWTVDRSADAVTCTQELVEPISGYGYRYSKTIRVIAGAAQMVLDHRLANIGRRPIDTNVYNHNFLALDGLPTGKGFVVKTPYAIVPANPPTSTLAEIRDRELVYVADLHGSDVVSTALSGFGPSPADYDFRVEHTGAKAGVRVTGDRPLDDVQLWSMRSTIAVEPFLAIRVAPGEEFTWRLTYTYY